MGEGNDNRPRLPLGARPLTFPRRLLGPKLAKSPSAASGAVIQQRRGGRHQVRKRSRRAAGASRARIRNARGAGTAAGSYLSCFSGSSACSGCWLALPQSQLLSRGCLPHCTRPGAPRPARLAAGREETGDGPIRAAFVGGAGRGGAGGRRSRPGGVPEANPAGRAPLLRRQRAGRQGKGPSAGGRTSLPGRLLPRSPSGGGRVLIGPV